MNYITYVLQSTLDKEFYVGYTTDLKKRINEHNTGKVNSTRYRKPLNLVYYELCFNRADALHREKYLKSSYGKRYIKNRLKFYLAG